MPWWAGIPLGLLLGPGGVVGLLCLLSRIERWSGNLLGFWKDAGLRAGGRGAGSDTRLQQLPASGATVLTQGTEGRYPRPPLV